MMMIATANPTAPPAPPRVQVHGFEHLDVVEHVGCGWRGTVHHDRRALGCATVRWHASFAVDELVDVAGWLRVVARRSAPRPTRPATTRVEPRRELKLDAWAAKIDGWAGKIDKLVRRS